MPKIDENLLLQCVGVCLAWLGLNRDKSCEHRLGEELAVWVRLNEDAVGSGITEDAVKIYWQSNAY